ncbi:MAG: hypothetical protein M3383_09430 [Actinomycetota bacterium]|nr:hypothetical protein [Actinomycetota bacterium]
MSRIDHLHPSRGRFGAVGVLSLGGAVLALAVFAGLSFTGAPAHAAFPGTNGKIACTGPKDRTVPNPDAVEDFEVYTINPDGTGQVFLTDNPVRSPTDPPGFFNDDTDPAFSPDGKKIAFDSLRSGSDDVYTMNSDGSGVTRVTAIAGIDVPIGWSADGSKIYLETTRTGNYEVFSINSDGASPTNLTNLPGATDVGPRGSPDGTKIVFWSNRDRAPGAPQQGGNFEIYSMNADGSGVARLTTNPTNDFNPDWSPDGRQIVFERAVTGQPNQIFRMNADGTGVTQLTNNPVGRNTQPIWSPDGKRIVFQSLRDSPPSPLPANNDVFTMNATDGSDVRRLTTAPGTDGGCDWQAIPAAATPVSPPSYPGPYPGPGPSPARVCPAASSSSVIRGTAGNNRITGTAAADRILSAGGDDVVDALPGNDCVDLGTGADRGEGGPGGDQMAGGRGRDRVSGSAGNDRLRGGPGNDRLTAGRGNDRAFGDSGNDLVLGSFGNDVLHGVGGNDRVSGSRGRDRINGGSGNDRIAGGSSGDRIAGDRGNDRLDGNSGSDRISGNSGNDRIGARDGKRDRINCGTGRDTVIADRSDRVARNCERVRRRGGR